MTASGPTFRDFAGALMSGHDDQAAAVLETLLALDAQAARAATRHFRTGMTEGGQPFMMKAMGLRGAVQGGDQEAIRSLLIDCFGLGGEALDEAVAALAARYGSDQ